MPEIPIEEVTRLVREYLLSKPYIEISNVQERQGNSKNWEKSLADFLRNKGLEFTRHDSICPDLSLPVNIEIKTVRSDRAVKSFSIAPLSPEEALTGVLPYRIVVIVWYYDPASGRGYAENAVVVPKEAKSVLTNWSFKGIQVKSGVSDSLIRQAGLLPPEG